MIRNTGINQDGKTPGLSYPSGDAQAALIASVYNGANLDPLETTYVEAHGTGTPAGDPIEAAALSRIFCPGRHHDQPLTVGSIKTNVGHLEGASGLAGVIKTVLMLEKKQIVPNVNFEKKNPRIPLEDLKMKVCTICIFLLASCTQANFQDPNDACSMGLPRDPSGLGQQLRFWWHECSRHFGRGWGLVF